MWAGCLTVPKGGLTFGANSFQFSQLGTSPKIIDGLLADLVIVDANPLENLQVLYGTGAAKLNDQTGMVEQVGGVKYTIKDGIVYDAKELLADVARMVEQAKRQ